MCWSDKAQELPSTRFKGVARLTDQHQFNGKKEKADGLAHSHKEVYKTVGTGILDGPWHINFGRDIVFSADLCYNGANEKPPSEREGGML